MVPTEFGDEHRIDVVVLPFLQTANPGPQAAAILKNQQKGRHNDNIKTVVESHVPTVNAKSRMTVKHFENFV